MTLLLVWSSSVAQDPYMIRGQAVGRQTGTVYLYESGVLGQPTQLVDSVHLGSQFFSFQRVLHEPAGYIITLSDAPGQFYFIWDTNVVVSLRSDDLNQSLLEESPVNEVMRSFSDSIIVLYDKRFTEIRQALSEVREQNDTLKVRQYYQAYYTIGLKYCSSLLAFIQSQNESWASLFMLLTHHKELGRQQTLELLGKMPPQRQHSWLGSRLKATVTNPSYLILP